MLKDRLSPADVAARENEMQEALAACPRILDLVARGPLADPGAEAMVYLRSPLDPSPVIVSNDQLMGCTKAAEKFFRARASARTIRSRYCCRSAPRPSPRSGVRPPAVSPAGRSPVHARGDHRPVERGEGKIVLAPPPGMPGGLHEKIEGLQKDVPSLQRIVVVPLDGTIAFDGEVLKPDPGLAR